MTTGRACDQEAYGGLKFATRQLVKRSGGCEAAAEVTRVRFKQASLYCNGNPEYDDVFVPVDIVLDWEKELGAPIVTAKLANLQGYELVRRHNTRPTESEAVLARRYKEHSNRFEEQLMAKFTGADVDADELVALAAKARRTLADLEAALAVEDGAAP